jgi:hypothetical protein
MFYMELNLRKADKSRADPINAGDAGGAVGVTSITLTVGFVQKRGSMGLDRPGVENPQCATPGGNASRLPAFVHSTSVAHAWLATQLAA